MPSTSGKVREKLARSAKRKIDASAKEESTVSQKISKRKTNVDTSISLHPSSVTESEKNVKSKNIIPSSSDISNSALRSSARSRKGVKSEIDAPFHNVEQNSQNYIVDTDSDLTPSDFTKRVPNSESSQCTAKQSKTISTSTGPCSSPSTSKYFQNDFLSKPESPVVRGSRRERKLKIKDSDNYCVDLTINNTVPLAPATTNSTNLADGSNISQTSSGLGAGMKINTGDSETSTRKGTRGRTNKSNKNNNRSEQKGTDISAGTNKLPLFNDEQSLTSSSLPPVTSQNSKTYLDTEGFPEIDFSDRVEGLLKSKPHIWPRCHDKSKNVFHYISNLSLGRPTFDNKQAVVNSHVMSPIADYEVVDGDQPFSCRITTIDWHPRKTNFIAVGSKHGDLAFYKVGRENHDRLQETKTFTGIGPGGYISALKFHPTDDEKFFTSSLDGKVCLGNIDRDRQTGTTVFLNTHSWERWFCSLDASYTENMVVSGMSNGWISLMDRNGHLVWEKRLHKQKVSHLEFSPREPYLLCSASLDHTVRLWDTRMMGDNKSLAVLLHDKGVNSAYFSLTDGTRLATTDQNDEIRVYRAPYWHKETTITHPHRFFQHITPIKAYWHPFTDNILCGRFPSERSNPEWGMKRTMDMFDAATGKMQFELKDSLYNGIISLCKFNNTGEKLLSAMGYNVYVWAHPTSPDEAELFTSQKTTMSSSRGQGTGCDRPAGRRPDTGGKKAKKGGDDLKKKKSTESKRKDSDMEMQVKLVIKSKNNQKKKDNKGKKK